MILSSPGSSKIVTTTSWASWIKAHAGTLYRGFHGPRNWASSGGGTHIGKGYGMCHGHDPIFSDQSPLPSLPIYCQCAALVTPVFNFKKIFCIFSHVFAPILSSLDPNFSKFSFPRRPFFKENPLPRSYILKPAWHTSTKKKLSAPPGQF